MGVTGVSMHIVPVSMHALVPVKPQATHAAIIQTKLLDAAHGALAAGIHQHTVEEGAESLFRLALARYCTVRSTCRFAFLGKR